MIISMILKSLVIKIPLKYTETVDPDFARSSGWFCLVSLRGFRLHDFTPFFSLSEHFLH